MRMHREESTFKLSLYLVKSRFVMGSRVDKSKLVLGLIGLTILSLVLGGVTTYSAILMRDTDTIIVTKDILVFFMLTITLWVFSYMIFGSLTGTGNPFISHIEDTYLLKRLPVDQQIMLSSSIIIKVIQISIFVFFFVISSILPPMIILAIPLWRVIFVFFALVSGFFMSLLVAILVYFALSKMRKKYLWINLLRDPGSPLLAIPYLGVPVLMASIIDSFPTFEQFSSFAYLPIVNSTIASTGFMLRSTVPTISWISLLISLVQIFILILLVFKIAKTYSMGDDIEILLPVLRIQQMQQESLRMKFGVFSTKPAEPIQTLTGIEGRQLLQGNNVFLFIKIYLLALFRIQQSRRTLTIMVLTTSVYFILRLTLILPEDYLLLARTIFVLIIVNIPSLIYRVDQNDPILIPIDSKYLIISKSILIFLISSIFSIPFYLESGFNYPLAFLILFAFSTAGGLISQTRIKYSKFNLIIFFPLISLITLLS